MIISFSTGKVETKGGSGLLQQKRVEVTGNGLDVVVPDAGYDGLSTVYVKTKVDGGGSSEGYDFSVIGYDREMNDKLNDDVEQAIAYSEEIYNNWDASITSMYNKYKNNKELVYFPSVDTSNVTNMYATFSGCTNLEYLPDIDTTNVNRFEYFLYNCTKLKRIPKLSLKNMTSQPFNDALYNGYKIIGNNTSATYFGGFTDCEHITKWFYAAECIFNALPALEVLEEMGTIKSSIQFRKCPNLTVDSLMVIINALYDFTGNGETPSDGAGLYLESINLAKLTEEQIAIGTAKGWIIQQ